MRTGAEVGVQLDANGEEKDFRITFFYIVLFQKWTMDLSKEEQ